MGARAPVAAGAVSAAELAPTLRQACARWWERPALTHDGRTLTYGQVWEQVTALAAAYRALGVRPGDRVVCQLPVVPEHVVAAAAAWACGAIHVGADKDLTGVELAALVRRTQASAVVHEPPSGIRDPSEALQAVRDAIPTLVTIVHGAEGRDGTHRLSDLLDGPSAPPSHPDGPEDTALLLLTSGTTGTPKAVMETLPALWAKMQFFADAVSCGPDDVHLMYLPIAHVFGLKLTLMGLASGGRVVLQDRFSPDEALRLVTDERVTVLPGTPTHLTLLLRTLDPGRHRVASLRWAVSAAAPLPPGLPDELAAHLDVDLLYVYGCSEGFLVRTTDLDDVRRGAVGRTVFEGPAATPPDGTVAVLDTGDDVSLPHGEIGEVAFGAVRPVRYWGGAPSATTGWYRTGDLGRLDPDGRLYLCGRLKDVVNRGGLKVACREVEAVLERHPDVADCAIVPTPDDVLGEAICACVVPVGSELPTLDDVRAHLGRALARHKLPDELCCLDTIPRSRVGKLDRPGLVAAVVDGGLPRTRLRPAPAPAAARARGT